MSHFLVVVQAVLVSVLAGGALFRGRRWWRYRLFISAALALVICELAPVALDVNSDLGALAIAGLLLAQGTLMYAMLRKEQAEHALLLHRVKVMLQDRVHNKLQVLAGVTDDEPEMFHTIKDIAKAIDELSDTTLAHWEGRYPVPINARQHA
jgi:hypothetical protein